MRILLTAASLRKASINKKLLAIAAQITHKLGHEIDLADFSEFDVPLYNQDDQTQNGIAAGAQKFIDRLKLADGLILASPEYNFSIPGVLKNLIDWVSRAEPQPWRNQPILLLSASPSFCGGNRGLWQIRIPLEGCGAYVYPHMFGLANAYEAFDETGQLNNPALHEQLAKMIEGFLDFSTRL